MEFWGIELKPKQTFKVHARVDHFLHLSQGALEENPTIDDYATVCVNLDNKKLAIGTLSSTTRMMPFDLVFERDFEFSNSSKVNSVHLTGTWVFQPAGKDGEKDEKAKLALLKRAKNQGSELPPTKETKNGSTLQENASRKRPIKIFRE